MSRRPRIHLNHVPLHIVQRGHSSAYFFVEEDNHAYLHCLSEAAHQHHRRRQDACLPVRRSGQPHPSDLARDQLLRHHHLRRAQPSERDQGTGHDQPGHLRLRRPLPSHHGHAGQRHHHQLRLQPPGRARQPRPQPRRHRAGPDPHLHPQPRAGNREPAGCYLTVARGLGSRKATGVTSQIKERCF